MEWISPKTLKPDREYILNGVKIKECLLVNHNVNNIQLPTKRTNRFKGVVIHNTNIARSEDDGRQYTAATLNGNMASRTHYYVTDLGAWKNLNDEDMNWTCGDGIDGEGNNGCISLEIIMNSKTQEVDLKARDNGARIAAYILYKNNMTVNDMYTHNYFLNIRNGVKGDYNKLCTTATPTRDCPYYIVWDWENFRKQVDKYLKIIGGKSVYGAETNKKQEQPSQVKAYIATSKAAIREDTSKTAKIITRVTRGYCYLATIAKDNWIKHTSGGYSMLKDGDTLFMFIGDSERKVTTTKVNVRTGPSTKSDKITVLNAGAPVMAIIDSVVKNEGYYWQKVVINNRLGYIAKDYLRDG